MVVKEMKIMIELRFRTPPQDRVRRLFRVMRAAWGDYYIVPCPRCLHEMYGFDAPRCIGVNGRLICPRCSAQEKETP